MLKTTLLAVLLGASGAASAIPHITIGPMYEFIDGEKSTLLKRIRNSGDQTAYIRTEVSEILYQGNGKKQERKIDAQTAANGQIDGLIFTPSRMIVPAKGLQSGRLVVTGSREKERYYRVRFMPVMPKDQYEFNQSKKEFDDYSKKLNAGVNVLTGYGAMVIVRPRNQSFNTMFETVGDAVVIKNQGNSSISLDTIKQCSKQKCTEASSTIVLPGQTHRIPKKLNHSMQFTLLEGNKKTSKSFG